jgi:hypothetical protein
MRPGSTLLLLLVALGAAYALYSVKPVDRTLAKAAAAGSATAEKLVKGDLGTTDSVTIILPERELRFTRNGALWQLGKPVHDVVDPNLMATLLGVLNGAEIVEEVSKQKMTATAWQLSGLALPEIRLVVRGGPNLLLDTWVANSGAVTGTSYLSRVLPDKPQPQGLLVRADLQSLLTLPPDRWRDTVMLNVPPNTVSRLMLKAGHAPIEVYREKPRDPWQMVKPLRTKAKSDKVEAVLKALASMKVKGIEPQPTDVPSALKPDQLQITVHSAQLGGSVELRVSPMDAKQPNQATLTASHRHGNFTVAGENLEALWWGVTELRDDHILDVNADQLTQVEITGGATGDVALRKEADAWQLRDKGEWIAANDKRVVRMFEQIEEMSVLEFVTDSATGLGEFGLVKPYLTLRWAEQNAPAATSGTVAAGGSFSAAGVIGTQTALQLGLAKNGNVYAKFEDKPAVFRVPASLLDVFPRDNVRWRSLSVLRFSPFSLRRISLTMGARPPIVLDYDPLAATWTGSSAGQSITAMIDGPKADMLAGKLGSLVVSDWLQNRSDAGPKLASPAITVGISLLSEIGNLKSPLVEHQLIFAPVGDMASSALFYGRLDRSPDVFLIGRQELLQLVGNSVFKSKQ